jgi:V/A-type H+-transporting ATPase subunit F
MKVYCVGSEEVVKGLALIGIEGKATADIGEAGQAVDAALARPDLGLLIVSERLAAPLKEKLTGWAFSHRQPLILEIPDEQGPVSKHSAVLSLVMEAVGLEQSS